MTLPPVYQGVRGIPTMYRGHEYDSTTEASFAAYLDAAGDSFKPHPMRFRSHTGRHYTPDFYLSYQGDDIYVDVKRAMTARELYDNRIQVTEWCDKLQWIRESVPHAKLWLVPWDDGYTFPRAWLYSPVDVWWLMAGENPTAAWGMA